MEDKLKDALREDMRQRMKQRLQTLEGERKAGNIRRLPSQAWLMAAGLALAVGLAVWLWPSPVPESASAVAQALFEPLPNVLAPEVRGEENAASVLQIAMQAYEAQEYSQFLTGIQNLPDSLQTDQLKLFQATAQLAEGQANEAIQALEELPSQPATQWYLCLAYLQTEQKDKAIELAQQLSQSADSFYRQRSNELLLRITK